MASLDGGGGGGGGGNPKWEKRGGGFWISPRKEGGAGEALYQRGEGMPTTKKRTSMGNGTSG